jgi:SAM-dependent methyltransferase
MKKYIDSWLAQWFGQTKPQVEESASPAGSDRTDRLMRQVRQIDGSFSLLLSRYQVDGPVCHVGSKVYDDDRSLVDRWRSNFANLNNTEFVGIDLEAGLNVDVVADLSGPEFFNLHPELAGRFGFVFCSALLEHVQNPFVTAANVAKLLKPEGCLYYSGPWVWGYHAYPDDYWRISISGLKVLFPDFDWLDWYYQGTKPKVGLGIKDLVLERKLFVFTPVTGVGSLISDRAMPYLNVTAIGRKKGTD